MKASRETYGTVAVTLHWLIAIAILINIQYGVTMVDNEDYAAYQTHKSLGITILALSVLRLLWRLLNPPPPLPAHMPAWERFAAHASHWGFYALMIGVPVGGWLYISASPTSDFVTTKVWGLFELPLIPPMPDLAERESVAEQLEDAHAFFGFYGFLGLMALHVAAALKHHFWDRDNVLTRMIPFLPRPSRRS